MIKFNLFLIMACPFEVNGIELKVWSEEEALQQRGGITPYSRRIFPCYVDTSDVRTLRWYVFYRNA